VKFYRLKKEGFKAFLKENTKEMKLHHSMQVVTKPENCLSLGQVFYIRSALLTLQVLALSS
jgi:hypothetical protein